MLLHVLLVAFAMHVACAASSCPANPGLIVKACNATQSVSQQPTCMPGTFKVWRALHLLWTGALVFNFFSLIFNEFPLALC